MRVLRADAASWFAGHRANSCQGPNCAQISIGPVLRLIIIGISPVSEASCAAFALTLGFEVIACDIEVGIERFHIRIYDMGERCVRKRGIKTVSTLCYTVAHRTLKLLKKPLPDSPL